MATTHTYRGTPRNIARLGKLLREGQLVAAPTETVYGLAANALDAKACRKIFRAKGRPASDPLIVHLHSLEQLEQVCVPNDVAWRLARRFWPGPLTLVLPKTALIPDVVTAGRDSVAVRMPSHPLFRRLMRVAGVPLAAPSANRFGYVSPTTADHVREGLTGRIPAILDGGATPIGVESTIVDVRNPGRVRILRPGVITEQQIRNALHGVAASGSEWSRAEDGERTTEGGRPTAEKRSTGILPVPAGTRNVRHRGQDARATKGGQLAPGMMARHYSPRTRVVVNASLRGAVPKDGEAFLLIRKPQPYGRRTESIFWLDERGDLRGAARRLFAMLRELDARGFAVIHAELAPERGIGVAINDRLRRAAS